MGAEAGTRTRHLPLAHPIVWEGFCESDYRQDYALWTYYLSIFTVSKWVACAINSLG